jgi:hypothetical protein
MKSYKLTRKQVKAYEKMAGFKTTGDVRTFIASKKTLVLLDNLYQPRPVERSKAL